MSTLQHRARRRRSELVVLRVETLRSTNHKGTRESRWNGKIITLSLWTFDAGRRCAGHDGVRDWDIASNAGRRLAVDEHCRSTF
jgi:hypothetical protein